VALLYRLGGPADTRSYCVDILVQLAAIRSALQAVGHNLLDSHVRHCVASALQRGEGEASIQELLDVIEQFTR